MPRLCDSGSRDDGQGLDGPALLDWYDRNRRDLPWRRSRDPYAIWVSEIMLQQTQVQTVVPYFERWMERYPTVAALAQATDEEALAVWQGLGYYRRCRMLLEGARYVHQHGMPASEAAWRIVPGVGRYTASAIASIADGEAVPVVDGNVERVFARLTCCQQSGATLAREAWTWAERNLDPDRPGDHNQARMELGATVCRHARPLCHICPLSSLCLGFLTLRQTDFPRPRAAKPTVRVDETIWLPYHYGKVGLRQTEPGGWWPGMWEFPRSKDSPQPYEGLILDAGGFVHSVTHHRIRYRTFVILMTFEDRSLRWVQVDKLLDVPLTGPAQKAEKRRAAAMVTH